MTRIEMLTPAGRTDLVVATGDQPVASFVQEIAKTENEAADESPLAEPANE